MCVKMVMRLESFFVVSILFYNSVNSLYSPTSSCPTAPADGFISGPSSTTPTLGTCSAVPAPSGVPPTLPQDFINPRYTRAIFEGNTGYQQFPPVQNIRFSREINGAEYGQDPGYARLMQASQQNTFTNPAYPGYYRPNGQEVADERGNPLQQVYSRPYYSGYDGSFMPPALPQDQISAMGFNKAPMNPSFGGARNCPYCKNPLPTEPTYQQMMTRSYQYQQSPQLLVNPFNQQYQQYAVLQGPVGYQNVNPGVKTVPTVPTEEVCPYSSDSAQEEPPDGSQISPGIGYNHTLKQGGDSNVPEGTVTPPASDNNPSSYLGTENTSMLPQPPIGAKLPKTGATSLQALKYMKTQKTEGVTKSMDPNGSM